ncbi:tetratricopeptide repeat protein [Psychrobacter sp. AOP22-C1-C5]|uniref:tetratricopeptide repeat protein n=1 Tax=Psychrobacter sp. AOP22-C1-C5 TaxID=3457716 RepID=UPI0040369805
MKAINQSTLSTSLTTKSPKFATLTALAAACAMLLSAPVNAAEADAATAVSVPSAMDSSKRVIRLARPNAAISTAQPDAQVTPQPNVPINAVANPNQQSSTQANISQQNIPQQSSVQQSSTQQNRAPINTNTAQPQAPVSAAATSELTGTTRVYTPSPMVATGVDLSGGQLPNIPTPQLQLSDVSFVTTVLIPQQTGLGTDKLDVSLLDDFIAEVSPNARHYPPNFPNRTQRHYTREKIKVLAEWIEPYAKAPNASYDVLLRAAKLNGMGRNLDLGSDYTVRGGQYVDRAIKLQPNSGEANFLYGMMLSEGGGFKEGQKYLDRAVSLGYTEAEQSLAQSELLSDRRDSALQRLRRLAGENPNNAIIREQIKLVEDGKFYIWDIPAPNINVKPSV